MEEDDEFADPILTVRGQAKRLSEITQQDLDNMTAEEFQVRIAFTSNSFVHSIASISLLW